jgi:hypothetical protein
MPRLKPLHERFAIEYIRTSSNAEAYRRARKAIAVYAYKPENARFLGYQLKNYPGVNERIEELRDAMAKRADITLDKLVNDVQEAMNLARLLQKPGEIITAAMAQGKLCGLYGDRVEQVNIDGNEPQNVQEVLDRVAQEVSPEAALALAKAFGLTEAEIATDKAEKAPEPLLDQAPPTDAVN